MSLACHEPSTVTSGYLIQQGDSCVYRPICLPSPSSSKGDMLGMTGFASGWGVTDLGAPKAQAQVLQQVSACWRVC